MFFIHNVLNKLWQDQFKILPVHKNKAWNSYSHLFLSLRFRNDPAYKNKQLTSTPNMYNPLRMMNTRKRVNTYSWTFIATLALGMRNFPDFKLPKQALINAFYMSAFVSHKDIGKAYTPPAIPIIADVSDCKFNNKLLYTQ